MTAAQATSMSMPFLPAASAPDRAVQQDGERSSDGGWQRALETASQDARPASAVAAEASYLLALGNLGMAPVAVVPLTPAALPMSQEPVPHSAGEAPRSGRVEVAAPPQAHVQSSAKIAARPAATVPAKATGGEPSMPAASHGSAVAEASHGPMASRGERASAAKRSASTEAARPDAVARPGGAFAAQAAHAITAYAAAMSGAPMSAEREADFSVIPRSTTVPVRVHVQWRDRVADVWIGLHRQAFDQLPDIRASVEDWVNSRGGVLGHVVCNGETLARVAPSFDFQGAL